MYKTFDVLHKYVLKSWRRHIACESRSHIARQEVTVLPSLSREPQKENAEKTTAGRNRATSANTHPVIQRRLPVQAAPSHQKSCPEQEGAEPGSRGQAGLLVPSPGGREEPRLVKPRASRATAPGSRGSCFGPLPVT